MGTWRAIAQARIAIAHSEIIAEEPGISEKRLRERINKEYYPFGPRGHFPYKVWLEELRKVFVTRNSEAVALPRKAASAADYSDMPLFGGE